MREDFRGRIVAQADSVAKLYRFGKEIDQPATREQKEFIEGIVATDYDGRTVVELLQNGHDAHPADRSDGQLEFLLREDEGLWGVLYVANAGDSIQHEDFTAMCRVAMSNKRPDEGIGNKGVGFKSVLQLADSPEVYSMAEAGSDLFDGYCFRFAQPADFDDVADRVAPGEPGFADELRENVASLKVPVPLDSCPLVVKDFAARGLVTVVRLTLRSAEARDQARRQLAELTSSQVPFHLFLDRVERMVVRRVEAGQKVKRTVRDRRSSRVFARDDLVVDEVVLQGSQRFLVFRQRVPEAAMKEAIARSRDDGRVSAAWDRWQGDARVSVALPLEADLAQGRLYTFLPMGENAAAPMAGFVNAPFFARLDRRSLDPSIPLNDLLLDQVAQLCAKATHLAVQGELDIPADLVIDLVAWGRSFLTRLTKAFHDLGDPLADVLFIPALGEREPRTAISLGWLWETTATTFTPAAAATAGVDHLIDPRLTPQRQRRLKALADDLGYSLTPGDDELAAWAEDCADELGRAPFQPDSWAEFYEDLAAVMNSGAGLSGRRIILDEHGVVIPAGTGKGGPTVFFAPQVADAEPSPRLSPPQAVTERIAFTHPAITWRPADPRRKRLPGREWLKQHNLVQEYRTDAVLTLVGSAMRAADRTDDALLRSCLLIACDIWRNTARDVAAEVIARAGLLVPTAGGWKPAGGAWFGAGWEGERSAVDDLLVRLLKRSSTAVGFDDLADSLIPEPLTLIEAGDDIDTLRRFLEHAGVRHGLVPLWLPGKPFALSGSRVAAPATVPDLPIGVDGEHQRVWRAVAERWPRQTPNFPSREYQPASDVAVLPGQFDYEQLDPTARRMYAELILHGLEHWPDEALEFQYRRSTDFRTVAWPTLLAAFLATADWLPQTIPGRRSETDFMSPARAWWLQAADTPDYLRAQPPALRSLATPKVLSRLKRIGVRCWDDPVTAADRLVELTDLVGSHRVGGGAHLGHAARKAYEAAWKDLLGIGGTVAARELLRVVATRAGRLTVVPLGEGAEAVYVADEAGVAQERLLLQAPVLMLAIRNRVLAGKVYRLLDAAGGRCLRRTSEASVVVTIDGLPAETAPTVPLLATTGQWLTTLVLAVMEFRGRSFSDATTAQLAYAAQRLKAATLTVAGRFSTSVDGHDIEDARTVRSFLLAADGAPCVVVTGVPGQHGLPMLQAASHGLAELVEMPTEADNLRLAFIDLQQRCGDTQLPTLADIAAVLGVGDADMAAFVAAQGIGHMDVSGLVAVLACVDVDLAEQLRDSRGHFDSPESLRAWLHTRLAPGEVTADVLWDLADHGDLLQTVLALGVDLATANRGLRALALSPLQNPQGHTRQLAAYVQQHQRAIQDRIRDAFLPTYQAGQPLHDYLQLRQLAELKPDKAWLDQYWDLPEQVIANHVDAWLHQSAPSAISASGLPSVDEIRAANRRRLSRILGSLAVLVEAWLHRNAAGNGRRPADHSTVADAMTQAGVLDFQQLTSSAVVRWLLAHQQWPPAMPPTTSPTELGLTDQDLTDARQRIDQAKEGQRREPTFINLDGHTYEAGTDLAALADAVRGGITAAQLATPADPLTPNESTDTPAKGSQSRSGHVGGTTRTTPAPEALKMIGLAGEIVASEWLHHQYGIPPQDSWVSGYRNLELGDGQGDDGLGYDFRIISDERIRLFEVKATIDDRFEFILGETEVRRAQNLQPDEEYLIIFIVNVLDTARRRIIPLPNPLAPGGLRHYHVAGRSIRLQFDLGQP